MLSGQISNKSIYQTEYVSLEALEDEQLGHCEVMCKPGGFDKVLLKKIEVGNKKDLRDLTIKWNE